MNAKPVVAGMIIASTAIFAEQDNAPYRLSGYAALQAGQIVKGRNMIEDLDHRWLQAFCFGLGADASMGNRLGLHIAGEAWTTFSYIVNTTNIDAYRETQVPRYVFEPIRAEGACAIIGAGDSAALQLGIGYFPYKYAPDVRNLGEFLFRSGTYPGYLMNYFDRPYARLLGLRISGLPLKSLRADLLFTSEPLRQPLLDWSVSCMARYTLPALLEAGAGVSFANVLSVNSEMTRPRSSTQNQYVDGTDTGYYTFAGTKVMAFASFDPKGLFAASILGGEDLKLYAEIAILGIKDYPVFYADIQRRMPIMVGLNIPAFRMLDVLSAECEYYYNKYPNSYYVVFTDGYPQPYGDAINPSFDHDYFKWSFYARKTLFGHFSIIGQVASDHLIPVTHSLILQDKADVLPKKEDWWWVMKTCFSF